MSATRITGRECLAQTAALAVLPLDLRSTGFQVAAHDATRLTTLYGNRDGKVAVLDRGAAPSGDAVAYRGEFNAAVDADLRA